MTRSSHGSRLGNSVSLRAPRGRGFPFSIFLLPLYRLQFLSLAPFILTSIPFSPLHPPEPDRGLTECSPFCPSVNSQVALVFFFETTCSVGSLQFPKCLTFHTHLDLLSRKASSVAASSPFPSLSFPLKKSFSLLLPSKEELLLALVALSSSS